MNLILFLISINVSKECILALLYYHYADGTIDGSGEYIESFSGLLCDEYKNEIMTVNKEFENKELLAKVIDYVLINEKNGCKVDYFYFGDNRKGVYEKADIVQNNIVYANDKYQHKYMRIGVLNFHPLKRSVLFSDKINYQKHICILKLNLRRYIKK